MPALSEEQNLSAQAQRDQCMALLRDLPTEGLPEIFECLTRANEYYQPLPEPYVPPDRTPTTVRVRLDPIPLPPEILIIDEDEL